MCEALKELMADELKEAKETGASEMKAKLTIIIEEKDKTIEEKDKTIEEKNKTISEQSALISKLQAELDKKR